jgi:predicted signal transduction protein with EAL and GGDEF domain
MKHALREGDTLARIGGDEFVAVLADLEVPGDCEPVLGRLLQAAADPVDVGGQALNVSASVGVTLYPQDDVDADQLMRHADQAMYIAKQSGKNRSHLFDVDQDSAVKSLRESLEHIQGALERREFVLHYQPKVNMKTGEVIGAEALIRWQHPERGLLPPAAFLPLIEDHPVSVALGEWVIDTALSQMAEWQKIGLDLPVSVNIGARQLQQSDFVSRLSALLTAHPDVDPSRLELEVLETNALEDMAKVSKVMRACRAIGVGIARDDVGTRDSARTYLKRLPAELLKIDQSFVRDMFDDPEDLAIVEGVVGLAAAFRRQVIAEGLEQVAHGDLLLPLGCELAQGYGIAHPMPGKELPAWVATWRPSATWTAWRERHANRGDLALAYAEVEHRQWLRALAVFLAGELDAPPPIDTQECRLGRWLETEGLALHGGGADFAAVESLHERIHALGRELVDQHGRGQRGEPRLDELRGLLDGLFSLLRELVREKGAGKAQ